MDIKEIGDWIAVIGAAVAAVASVWNLRLQLRGKQDQFVVRLGGSSPSIEQETMLHVVSHSDHPVKLTDWGFIEADGSFTSFPMEWETGGLHTGEITSRGTTELEKFGAFFETGHIRRPDVYGAYAISITRRRPCVCFSTSMPIWRRWWIRLRLWFQPQYLSW